MKSKLKLFGIVALIAVIGLSMAGCNLFGDDDDGPDSHHLGTTLNLSGQVWTWNEDWDEFTGNRTVTSTPPGGTGGITNGQLNFTIGRPTSGLESAGSLFDWTYNNFGWSINVNPSYAMGASLRLNTPNGFLNRGNETYTGTEISGTAIEELVEYIFVDRDVTISAARLQGSWSEDGETWTYDARAFYITLREGWNALHWRFEGQWTATGGSETITLSAASPGRWILIEWDGHAFSEDLEPSERTPLGRAGAFRPSRVRR